jgi:hypothetical protein
MNRNILKLTSMLFVGLVLATSCSKEEPAAETKAAELGFAKQVAAEAATSIDGLNVTVAPYNAAPVVRAAALLLLKGVKTKIEAAKSEASDPAKVELDKAIAAIDAYTSAAVSVAAGSSAAEVVEKAAAKKAADDAKAAVDKAATL